jgi:hypothetical protein
VAKFSRGVGIPRLQDLESRNGDFASITRLVVGAVDVWGEPGV